MADGFDWPRYAIQAASALASAGAGLLVGVWQWGRKSAIRERRLEERLMARATAIEKSSEARMNLLVEQFTETFAGLRRQIDEHRFYTERDFLRKEDFKDFREEYREDMREIKESISAISKR